MWHNVFGEIEYDRNGPHWEGTCKLSAFAEFGREPRSALLDEPDEAFGKGLFSLRIQDYPGIGPLERQVNAFRYLLQEEQSVCREVISELLQSYRESRGLDGSDIIWTLWGRIVRWVAGKPYETIEELKPVARCIGVEVSTLCLGEYAYVGFDFDAEWKDEHGLAIVYHPTNGTFWGDGTAIADITEADNFDTAYGR
jgi:hypothetical protein